MQRRLLFWLTIVLGPLPVMGGPPFVTDDPEPVEYQHWEVYVSSQLSRNHQGWTGTAPKSEINYGALPNLQLHVMFSDDFTATSSSASEAGFGDIELGIKYRFIQQTRFLPDVAVYPQLEIPTASRSRGLGDGETQCFLPVWTEKDFGKWTVNAGLGYYINPGPENLNWWFTGAMLQRRITDQVAVGTELFHQTVQVRGGRSSTYINPGVIWDLNDLEHLLLSVGHTVQGSSGWQSYVGIQFTFGPKEAKGGS
jgi:hypothetical protein